MMVLHWEKESEDAAKRYVIWGNRTEWYERITSDGIKFELFIFAAHFEAE